MLASKIYDNREVKSYMKTQFKSIKKNQELLTSEEVYNDIKIDIAEKHNVLFSSNNGFVIKFDKKNGYDDIIIDLIDIMGTYYKNMDINLLYKFSIVENSVVVQKKR